VFGQWLSGMARMYKATGDTAIRDKAVLLMTEWAKTVTPEGDCRMRHYPFEKLTCGLIDMKLYAGSDEAVGLLEKVIEYAKAHFDHQNVPGGDRRGGYAGNPGEWYTLAENPYRAYVATGKKTFKEFGDMWLYDAYWNKFLNSTAPDNAHGVHAYSHVNTFSSCAMAYAVTGDAKYLTILKNAYVWLQEHQCYATGGFGPTEFIVTNDGGLGNALTDRTDSFETGCGSWAVFKMGKYLMSFTGEARYGDWIERILYNGIGAALPITPAGKNFYYSDYRAAGAFKVYCWENWTCCSGTYIQAIADYHNIIYFKDPEHRILYVNLYVPSEVTWKRPAGDVKVTQETTYPEGETSTFTVRLEKPAQFAINFRVPGWVKWEDVEVKINNEEPFGGAVKRFYPATGWLSLVREWAQGDKVTLRIPLRLRMVPVDKQHPDRVAIVRGPVVLALEASRHDPNFYLPDSDEELNKWVKPYEGRPNAGDNGVEAAAHGIAGAFAMTTPKGPMRSLLRPFYTIEESYPYNLYHDKKNLPYAYW